jgi:hypothetical protein
MMSFQNEFECSAQADAASSGRSISPYFFEPNQPETWMFPNQPPREENISAFNDSTNGSQMKGNGYYYPDQVLQQFEAPSASIDSSEEFVNPAQVTPIKLL